jgi:hypothetical protein
MGCGVGELKIPDFSNTLLSHAGGVGDIPSTLANTLDATNAKAAFCQLFRFCSQ